MNLKKIIALPLVVSLLSAFTINTNVNAATCHRLVDNDPVAAGCSFSCSNNMTYYSGISGSYNNDMRLSSSIYDSNAYSTWEFPTYYYARTSCKATLNVYLNNANFTDPAAQYLVQVDINDVFKNVGTINQKYAPSGWSSITKTITSYGYKEYISCSGVSAYASSGSYKQLGADAIELYLEFS